jgi:hypothetical protein
MNNMNSNRLLMVIVLLLVIIAGILVLIFVQPKQAGAPSPTPGQVATTTGQTPGGNTDNVAVIDNLIEVTLPLKNANVSSPLVITGQARGAWYFEASAPVELRDAKGKVIAQGHIEAQSDWMTEDFVPFKATLTFAKQPAGSTGTLVLQNDNPSGDPARQKELLIPVKF